jgi:FAD/FMN-containing dehydrogenase
MVEATIALARRVDWAQVAVSFPSFASCFDFAESVANDARWTKRLVAAFEWPIPAWFTPLVKWVPMGKALVFLEVADDQLAALTESALNAGGSVPFTSPFHEPRRGAQLSDYTWNHTTLWAKKGDPTLTYLQAGFSPSRVRDQMRSLKDRFGDELIMHFEFLKSDGVVVPGSLPIVRFTTEARLQEMIDHCGEIGVGIANPHINHLEGSGRWRPDDAKLVAKAEYDPGGLLNPGKMSGYAPSASRADAAPTLPSR